MSFPTKTVVAVVGCHRSGTSAITGCVTKLGADCGKSPMIGASRSNPLGHYESSDIVWAHRMLLAFFDANWDSPALPDGWQESEAFDDTAGILALLLERDFEHPLSVVKDPRMATLYPLWKSAARRAGVWLTAILVDRDDREVLRSLMERDGRTRDEMNPPKAKSLLSLARAGMKEWEAAPHSRVRFPDDLAGMEVWKRAEAELGLTWPIPVEKAEGRIRAFVTPGLAHTSSAA